MSAASDPSTEQRADPERRVNLRLRSIFEEALLLVEPFFDTRNSWFGQSLDHFAFRVLRDHYPDLSGDEIFVFVTAARRVYAGRQQGGGDTKP